MYTLFLSHTTAPSHHVTHTRSLISNFFSTNNTSGITSQVFKLFGSLSGSCIRRQQCVSMPKLPFVWDQTMSTQENSKTLVMCLHTADEAMDIKPTDMSLP